MFKGYLTQLCGLILNSSLPSFTRIPRLKYEWPAMHWTDVISSYYINRTDQKAVHTKWMSARCLQIHVQDLPIQQNPKVEWIIDRSSWEFTKLSRPIFLPTGGTGVHKFPVTRLTHAWLFSNVALQNCPPLWNKNYCSVHSQVKCTALWNLNPLPEAKQHYTVFANATSALPSWHMNCEDLFKLHTANNY